MGINFTMGQIKLLIINDFDSIPGWFVGKYPHLNSDRICFGGSVPGTRAYQDISKAKDILDDKLWAQLEGLQAFYAQQSFRPRTPEEERKALTLRNKLLSVKEGLSGFGSIF